MRRAPLGRCSSLIHCMVGGEGFGAVDAAVEADDALEVVVLDGFEQADLGGERFAVCLDARTGANQFSVGDPLCDGGVVHADDDDAVIGEQFLFKGFAKRQGVQPFAKQGGVVHADNFDTTIFGGFMDGAGVGARGGGGE